MGVRHHGSDRAMNHSPHPRDTSALAGDSFARDMAVTLAVLLAVPAVVLAVSQPALAVTFVAGLVSARALQAVEVPSRASTDVAESNHAPAQCCAAGR